MTARPRPIESWFVPEPQDEPRVDVQPWARPGRRTRWAYVLHVPGYWAFVSAHSWGSAETARAAGEADLAGFLEAIEERDR